MAGGKLVNVKSSGQRGCGCVTVLGGSIRCRTWLGLLSCQESYGSVQEGAPGAIKDCWKRKKWHVPINLGPKFKVME